MMGGRSVGGIGSPLGSAMSSRSNRILSHSTTTMEQILRGIKPKKGSSPLLSHGHSSSRTPTDKTVCQYCGVSYLTMSEMRTTVKEQEERLTHYKSIIQENLRLKNTLANIRKTHVGELIKQEEAMQRVENVKESLLSQVEGLKREVKETKGKYSDLEQRYNICSEDSRHQEEVICELRDVVEERSDVVADNSALKEKVKSLESTLQRVLLQFREVTNNQAFSPSPRSHGKVNKTGRLEMGDHPRNKINQDVKAEQSGWGNWKGPPTNPNPKVSSLASVETHDLKRQIALLSEKLRCVSEEHANCPDLHGFLRDTIDKLNNDNMKLHERMNCSKVKCEERSMDCSNLEAKLEGVIGENGRLKDMAKQTEYQLRLCQEQNRAIRKAHDPKLVDHLQKTVQSLQLQFQDQRSEIEEMNVEFEKKLAEAQRESGMEKERADSFLANSLSEREEVEKRWEERWDRHQLSLNQQLDALKGNHEETVRKTKEHEIHLQKDLTVLNEKFEKSKEAWEVYRKTLQGQTNQWKSRYEEKSRDLESTRKSKVDVEILFQEKSKELEMLHEMVREGCEERQELQKKVEILEESLEEVVKSHGSQMKRFYNNDQSTFNPNQFQLQQGIGDGVVNGGKVTLNPSPVKHSNSESLLSRLSRVSGPMGLEENGVNVDPSSTLSSSQRPFDLNSILFTVGKGKQNIGSGSGSISVGKEKTSKSKIISQSKGGSNSMTNNGSGNGNCIPNGSTGPTQIQIQTQTLQIPQSQSQSRKSNK